MSKSQLQQQAHAALETSLLPGESLRMVSVALSGPNPFLDEFFFMAPFFTEFYVGLTETRLLLVEASDLKRRGLDEFAASIRQVTLIRSRSRAFYLCLWVAWPPDRTMRLNFDARIWGDEARALLGELRGGTRPS